MTPRRRSSILPVQGPELEMDQRAVAPDLALWRPAAGSPRVAPRGNADPRSKGQRSGRRSIVGGSYARIGGRAPVTGAVVSIPW